MTAKNQSDTPDDALKAQPRAETTDRVDVDGDVRAEETPVERAQRLGQGDDVNPAVPTGQTPEDVARSIPGPYSNEELQIAADKRRAGSEDAAGDDARRGARRDERGQTTR